MQTAGTISSLLGRFTARLSHLFLCVRVCTCSFFVRVHIQTLIRLQPTSDRCHFYFSEDDFSGATVCSTPLPVSFNLVIRMACCVIVAPKTQALVARKKAKCGKKEWEWLNCEHGMLKWKVTNDPLWFDFCCFLKSNFNLCWRKSNWLHHRVVEKSKDKER